MKSVCAPNIDISEHYTCFTQNELKDIAESFNLYIKTNNLCNDKKICVPKKKIEIEGKSKKQLWDSIYKRLNKICKYEYCWIDLEFINVINDDKLKNKLKYFTFKPKTTLTNYSWLSTNDINYVLQQYQELDKTFKFLGTFPSDFYNFLKFDYTSLVTYNLVAIVLNLDSHDKTGSHWVSLVIDNNKKTIEYFDSLGKSPNTNIKQFIKLLRVTVFPKYKYKWNKIKHQNKNTECGVYSIYFIIQRFLGYTFDEINKAKITDEQMNLLRSYIFRPK